MKAAEVLRRYAVGERDCRRLNPQGQSFMRRDLLGANFSKADIQGVQFVDTNLSGSKVCGARAGLQQHWTIGLVIASWLLSELSAILLSAKSSNINFVNVSGGIVAFANNDTTGVAGKDVTGAAGGNVVISTYVLL